MEKCGVKGERIDFFRVSRIQYNIRSQFFSLAQATASDYDYFRHFCLHRSERSVFHHRQFKPPDVQDSAWLDSIHSKNALLSDNMSCTVAMAHVHPVLAFSLSAAQMAGGTTFNGVPQFDRLYARVCRVRTNYKLESSLLIHP
jgi:hypothetical protein